MKQAQRKGAKNKIGKNARKSNREKKPASMDLQFPRRHEIISRFVYMFIC